VERLEAYAALLLRWNRTINLIGRADEAYLWRRHVADSLQLMPLLAPALSERPEFAVDLGSGGGLPGLVLAIATDIPFHLVESDARKAAFLREAARAVAAPVAVHTARVESVRLPPTPVITARALAPLAQLLAWAHPLLRLDGRCLFPKGRNAESELTAARAQWNMRVERTPSLTDPAATILQISEIRRVGQQ
jgi:16S rRNA (guanine527-N7)-methyltransferase